jgi:hypothetical protein
VAGQQVLLLPIDLPKAGSVSVASPRCHGMMRPDLDADHLVPLDSVLVIEIGIFGQSSCAHFASKF